MSYRQFVLLLIGAARGRHTANQVASVELDSYIRISSDAELIDQR
jgi:hypothetical protein